MYIRKCKECGRQMYFRDGVGFKPFCSKRCSDIHKEKMYNDPDNGPVMPRLDADRIADEGYIALMKAMVNRASQDVTKYKPGTQIRVSAEKFFESDHFTALTGLDGKPILRKLQREYERKQKRKPKYPTCKVLCVETGTVYASIKEAAEAYGIDAKWIYNVCKGFNKTTAGMHWRYLEEGN